MRVPISPFPTASNDMVALAEWSLRQDDQLVVVPRRMEDWSYQTKLSFCGDIRVQRAEMLGACGLGEGSQIEVVVRARSDGTGITRAVYREELPTEEVVQLALAFDLPGAELSGRLVLETLLVVVKPERVGAVAASLPGSILWSSCQRTDLEGVGAQFPTDAIHFGEWGRRSPEAAWELKIDLSDPDALFMSAVRLYLNTARKEVVHLLEGDKSEKTQLLRRTLHWDVTRQLVGYALASDEVTGLDFDPEARSLAAVLRNVLATVWPGVGVSTIRNWRDLEPERIETHLQQHCRLVP